MPKRFDIDSVLILGPGPVVIGQGCEFDYSSVQACLGFKEEGIRTIALSSNSASLMTDPALCDATYIEPMTVEYVEKIFQKERPRALFASVGGQKALTLAIALKAQGVLERYDVELIGPSIEAIIKGESRDLFYQAMQASCLPVAPHRFVRNHLEALEAAKELSFPILVRKGFCLGGEGSCFVHTEKELLPILECAFAKDEPLMLDTALVGWKEFELEILVDASGVSIVVCGIENIDPMGIHTGDSIAVAPVLTITDTEYQAMRKMAFACVQAIGFHSGGANVQLAMHPVSRQIVIVEMNPRMSRSSALASKATGYSIAKVAARLSLGYYLREIRGDLLCQDAPASYEPALDYVVVKIPKFQFEKFQGSIDKLGPKMQAVGEVMGVGASFQEALTKAMQGIGPVHILTHSLEASSSRIFSLLALLQKGFSLRDIHMATGIDMWFLDQIAQLALEQHLSSPSYCFMDSTAAELISSQRVVYSTYMRGNEVSALSDKSIIVIGGGACRIGQGIEFDALAAQALFSLRRRSLPSIMINDNPSAVSTDHTFSGRLYISPLTLEHVLHICHLEKPQGVILSFGGQTSLALAEGLEKAGIPLLGLSAKAITLCEDRKAFRSFIDELGVMQPFGKALHVGEEPFLLNYPVIARPSFVIGGKGMCVLKCKEELLSYLDHARSISEAFPILIEEFLHDAIEVDIDLITDGFSVYIPALQEHLEPAGIHSGDSIHIIPPQKLSKKMQNEICSVCEKIALALKVRGVINIQLAVQKGLIYVIEVNPRAARTLPFLSKAIHENLVDLAIGVMLEENTSLPDQKKITSCFVKKPIFSTHVFAIEHLSPEMRSTGEVMGWADCFDVAVEKTGSSSAGNVCSLQERV